MKLSPDEKLIADLDTRIEDGEPGFKMFRRCVKAIRRLVKQRQAAKRLVRATNSMWESTGVTIEVRDAMTEFDTINRPIVKSKRHGVDGYRNKGEE